MIIGITGTDGAGKGTVVEYLVKEKGFAHYHARALFIAEIEKQGIENNRANMRLVANQMRKEYGNDAIVSLFLKQAEERGDTDVVIDSIRAMAEVDTLKKAGGVLLAIGADPQVRYQRITKRNSSSDHVTYEEFLAHEKLEMHDPDPHGMQKADVIASADHTIYNDNNLSELHAHVDVFLKKFGLVD